MKMIMIILTYLININEANFEFKINDRYNSNDELKIELINNDTNSYYIKYYFFCYINENWEQIVFDNRVYSHYNLEINPKENKFRSYKIQELIDITPIEFETKNIVKYKLLVVFIKKPIMFDTLSSNDYIKLKPKEFEVIIE